MNNAIDTDEYIAPIQNHAPSSTLGGFLKRTQRVLLDAPWQIIQVMYLL